MSNINASIYYAEIDIDAPLERTWERLVDYQAWNPNFAHAKVTTIKGQRGAQGEVIHIDERDAEGAAVQEFYAETTRIEPGRRIAWFVYPLDREEFRNFVDFELVPRDGGVTFQIRYYAQVRGEFSDAELAEQTAAGDAAYVGLAKAFKEYAESA